MGFDAIDKRFARKETFIKLECQNCSGTNDVRRMLPLWYNGHHEILLCKTCAPLAIPTSEELKAQRDCLFYGEM